MSNDIKDNIKQQSTWKRGLYMVLFSIFYTIAEVLLVAIVVFQFALKLVTDDSNDRLRRLGQSIGTFIYQIIQFLTFNSEYHPYPFGTWPKGALNEGQAKTEEPRAEEPKAEEPKAAEPKKEEPAAPKKIKTVTKKAPPKKAKKS